MNPFDLPGPEFLVFYLVFGIVVLTAIVLIRYSRETAVAAPRLTDPYIIAYLRGGKDEAHRVAAASLLDRKLLTMSSETRLKTVNSEAIDIVRRPIERRILEKFKDGGTVQSLFTDVTLAAESYKYQTELVRLGMLPDEQAEEFRNRVVFASIILLAGTAITKIVIALSRGRTNILFLILMSIVMMVLAYRLSHPRRTRAGDAVLDDLQTLFGGLRGRAASLSPGGKGTEAAFLAAVFGLGALPAGTFPFAPTLQRRRATADSSSSSWFSSCGSSSSCGGGGCGGGGCGGGCGGCGS
jgi:uncharacterized protein (TIGR04222 family)